MNTNIITQNTVHKPSKVCVPLAEAMNWNGTHHNITRKLDGEFDVFEFNSGGLTAVLACELMQFKRNGFFTPSDHAKFASHGVWRGVYDLLSIGGLDMRRAPLRLRWAQLCAIAPRFDAQSGLFLAEAGFGGDFVAAVMADGAEGCVAKLWSGHWGETMTAAKRLQTFSCSVTRLATSSQSVGISDATTGQPRGNVCLFSGKCDRVRVGSKIKVEGLGLGPSGSIREPRICSDSENSWLISY